MKTIFAIIFALLAWAGILCVILKISEEAEKQNTYYMSFINKNIIISKDTCLILDYSYVKDSYMLNTGAYIDGTAVRHNNFKMY